MIDASLLISIRYWSTQFFILNTILTCANHIVIIAYINTQKAHSVGFLTFTYILLNFLHVSRESPYFNGNNICRKLNFDDDIDDFSGNCFMPQAGIFEEKKGVFSNFNMNYLLMPQA